MYKFGVGERTPWGDFPPVIRNAELGKLRRETEYVNAKQGCDMSALILVARMFSNDAVQETFEKYDHIKPTLLPVLAMDSLGKDRIPLAMSCYLADKYGWDVEMDIVQSDKVNRVGSSLAQRIAFTPKFEGNVEKGRQYLIVDDSLITGGTIASLRGFVENRRGKVVAAMVMTANEEALNISVSPGMVERLEAKHGPELNNYFKESFGYGIDKFTSNEAKILQRTPSFDAIRDKITEARNEYLGELDEKPIEAASEYHSPDHQRSDGVDEKPTEPAFQPGMSI